VQGDVVLDVGANVGVFAIFAARQTIRPVIAYEPSPEDQRYLADRHQAAVAERHGTVRLYFGGPAGTGSSGRNGRSRIPSRCEPSHWRRRWRKSAWAGSTS
jgi:FkbM family methyltransferase